MANYEQLFLLEVLVDRVRLLAKALEAFMPECEDEPDTPVRIRVKFSDFPCFEITQDLAPPDRERPDSDPLNVPIVFSSGKSCMFPMDPEQLIQDLIKYPMAVTVFKKNQESPLPEIIGQTKVPLGDYMSNIIKRAAEWALEEPLSEMIQDTFPLRNMQDQDVGTITMLVRLTCFGKTIITKFQIADNKKSFLFKNAKTQDYEFKCKKCMPGQPIQRLRLPPQNEEEEECNEGYWEGGYGSVANASTGLVDKEQMTEGYQDVCNPAMRSSPREMYTQGPGFHRHEGPGLTASMEVGYPDDTQDNGIPYGNVNTGPSESQSTPAVKKEQGTKPKARGKSADPKKIDVENGVKLTTHRRKKKTKFHVPQGIAYPGVILGHKYCVSQGPPVPARNGWAWKTTVPLGMKWEDVRGRRPGAYLKQTWATMKAVEELKRMGKRKKVKRRPVLPDTRKTTVHIHRIKGVYHVTMNPVKGPDDKEDPEPVVYTLERPEDGSDASEIELDLTVPDPPYPPPPKLKHQAQQFCDEDLPLIQPKQVFIKKKKKKERPTADAAASLKKKKPGSAKSTASSKSEKDKSLDKAPPKGKEPAGKGGAKKDAGGKGAPAKSASGKAPPAKGKAPSGKGGAKESASVKGAPAKGGSAKAGSSKQPDSSQGKGKKKGKKKGDDEDDVYPWDEWIMKLRCKNKQKRSKDWEPGDIPPEILELIELSRERRGLPPPKVNPKTKRRKSSELVPLPDKIEGRPPTLHVHRHKGSYHITMYPVVQPGDEYKDIKQPLKFTINRPDLDDEYDSESDLEFEFEVPEPDTAIQMVNHQTQYNPKDCPLPPPPPPPPVLTPPPSPPAKGKGGKTPPPAKKK
ncbi:hypothetical protein RUM44_001302 [Polyplax serrata]|uniref:DUF4776 domain-containing protein n=1 Tax=Polyplax serrata TaxID=468196 RepID=A0ABR1AJP4_POLSC